MTKEMTVEELIALYGRVMPSHGLRLDDPEARFTLRVWDGMDGCWTDCAYGEHKAVNVPAEKALRAWAHETDDGTKRVSFSEIDYYRIFPAGTRMAWDGSDGREMFR